MESWSFRWKETWHRGLLRVGMATDVLNLIAIVKASGGKPGPLQAADASNIGMWGHSMGGGITTRVITISPDVKAALLYSPMSGDEQKNYEAALADLPPRLAPRRLMMFLGSTIGNLDPAESAEFFAAVARALEPGDALLLGFDLAKTPGIIEAAYNDAQGMMFCCFRASCTTGLRNGGCCNGVGAKLQTRHSHAGVSCHCRLSRRYLSVAGWRWHSVANRSVVHRRGGSLHVHRDYADQ